MRHLLFLLIIGLGGASVLTGLGVWQMQRLAWKQGMLAEIEARIAADPVALPADPDPLRDAYLPVTVTGPLGVETIRVLVSRKQVGAGYRIIRVMDHPEGPILIDQGFVPVEQEVTGVGQAPVTVIGNLQWPQETDSYTPAPDTGRNIWFARDVEALAEALGTRPVLVVQREVSDPDFSVAPMPVDTTAIPNDHLQYAITWFSLAAIWLAMTIAFLRRPRAANKRVD